MLKYFLVKLQRSAIKLAKSSKGLHVDIDNAMGRADEKRTDKHMDTVASIFAKREIIVAIFVGEQDKAYFDPARLNSCQLWKLLLCS